MIRISPLLLLILLSFTDHVGSVVLTSVPLTAIDEELFTMICSSNTSGESNRAWYRFDKLVFQTTKGSSSPAVSNTYAFNMYLSGRINVSCNVLQHNVTLRINSTIDNRSLWTCFDNTNSQRSNNMTISVTELQTTDATKSTRSTSVITTTTTDISLSGSTGVTETQTETSPKSIQSSTTSATTNKGTTISTNEGKAGSGQDNTIAIAAGGACGSVAVIAVVIVVAVCIRKRRRSVEEDAKDKTRRDRIPSKSAEMLIDSGITEIEEIVMQDNVIYTSSSDVAPADYRVQDNNPLVKDVYTQVKKVKKPADQHVVTDVYAKPNKVGKETCNTDVYAKVNKVKKTASDQPKDTSESIEDMYAKPQKNKQNQQNKTPWLD